MISKLCVKQGQAKSLQAGNLYNLDLSDLSMVFATYAEKPAAKNRLPHFSSNAAPCFVNVTLSWPNIYL